MNIKEEFHHGPLQNDGGFAPKHPGREAQLTRFRNLAIGLRNAVIGVISAEMLPLPTEDQKRLIQDRYHLFPGKYTEREAYLRHTLRIIRSSATLHVFIQETQSRFDMLVKNIDADRSPFEDVEGEYGDLSLGDKLNNPTP